MRNIVIATLGITGSIKFFNMYIWLNMHYDEPIYPMLRMLDIILDIPVIIITFLVLHSITVLRLHPVSDFVRLLTLVIPLIVMLPVSTVYLFLDINTARTYAIAIIIPTLVLVFLGYLYALKNNPVRISRPTFFRGSYIMILALLLIALSEGIVAGLLRLLDAALLLQVIGFVLVSFGAIVQGISFNFQHFFELGIALLVVDRKSNIVSEIMPHEKDELSADTHLQEMESILHRISSVVKQVFDTGLEKSIPLLSIDNGGEKKSFRIEVFPFQFDISGEPINVGIAIDDVSTVVVQSESKVLTELVGSIVFERNRAEFYLDTFGHDMSNILQAITFAIEVYKMEKRNRVSTKKHFQMIESQLARANKLVNEIRENAPKRKALENLTYVPVKEFLERVISKLQQQIGFFKVEFQEHDSSVLTPVPLNDSILNAVRLLLEQCIISQPDDKCISLAVGEKDSSVTIEFGPYIVTIPHIIDGEHFDAKIKALVPKAGVWFGLGNDIIRYHHGRIRLEFLDPLVPSLGSKFVIEFPREMKLNSPS